ncbi:hypothetical protein PBY51_022599 [Eleginops maclovinus]|uniref:Secreted protein n=1 Tax=Eleginops maclovinus TaxID=56733 RepID=A0AAN7XJ04_ELEMC|nr:hypothetical protein PBY51_022599 [Eleginops maclovinus]
MVATLAIFHLSSFILHPTSCLFLSDTSSPSIPPPHSTCTVPSSHDHLVVERPQVLIIKASPDTPPHSVCSPVRLIPQIWRKKGV